MAAAVFARAAGQRAAEVVGADERAAGELVSEGRVGIAIDLALGVGGDDQRALRDGQVGADIGDGVVGAGGQGVLLDRVGAHVFTGHTAQGAAEAVATDERATGKLIGQGGVAIAIHLGLCVGSDRQRPRRNREVWAYVGERIVGSGGQGTLLDRIGADGLAWIAGQRAGERVTVEESAGGDLVGQRWIVIAVELALGIGSDGQESGSDRQSAVRQSD